jgi:membrane protein DedA with SNARE-associated domain
MTVILDTLSQFLHAMQTGSAVPWGAWSYVMMGVLAFIEGPIVTVLGAAAASTGLMNPWLVMLSASFGNLTADSLWYFLGYAGRTEWLVRHGRLVNLRPTHIEHLRRDLNLHARKILLVAKLSPGLPMPALIAAGMARVPWRRWFPVIFAAEMVWTGSLVLIGYHLTLSISKMEAWLKAIAIAAMLLFFFMIGRYGLRFLRKWGELVDADDENNGQEPAMAPDSREG